MTRTLAADVVAAQAGDLRAFQRLVESFQDQVTGAAFSWLGDIEAARDVAQEVFLEAHLCLHQLTEPAAFPGWLKRIVVKRCDRVTRRKSVIAAVDVPPDVPSADSDPSRLTQLGQQAEQLHLAISALPDDQRMVIALQYFADISGEEIARFLELPLTTVKKRLYEARRKLRDQGDALMQKSIENMRPSASSQFSEETAFFVALRDHNLAEMRRLLEASPELANAEQNWSPELAHQRVLPFPNKATALITAVELDDMSILELLLEAGADPNGRCGCATGESAVWTAALFNRPRQLKRLLEHGANPNVLSAAGNTPLQVAAIRGHSEVARILLRHGAERGTKDVPVNGRPPLVTVAAHDARARTAADWARLNGFDVLADEIDGRGQASAQRDPCAIGRRGESIETGIRAIDFFAPIERQSIVRMPFAAGVGMIVLLGELSIRFGSAENTAVVWTGFCQPPFDKQDFEAEMAEFGLQSTVSSRLASFKEPPAQRRAAFESGIAMIETLRDQGKQVLAIMLSTQGFEQDIDASLPGLAADHKAGGVTAVVVTPFGDSAGPWTRLHPPYTAQWTLNRSRANQRLYPAIDPDLSMSAARVSARHEALLSRATALLAECLAADPTLEGFDPDISGTLPDDPLAYRLLRHFSQSFRIATPFGGLPGEYTPLAAQLGELEHCLSD